jgi:SAM-dependent methyltransferase
MTPPPIRTASHRATNDRVFELISERLSTRANVLDLGSGHGHLARRVGQWFERNGAAAADHVLACDVAAEAYEAKEVPFLPVDFNKPLPFGDASFDLVYAVEVFEHLHRPYDVLGDCFRILNPGGWLIATTPNILHLGSRLRYFFTGFFDLYQPPSIDVANAGRICGHVMPLHLAYYSYGLRRAGFSQIAYTSDRLKKGARALHALFYPLMALAQARLRAEVRSYDAKVYQENAANLKAIGSAEMLASRSLVFTARKPLH